MIDTEWDIYVRAITGTPVETSECSSCGQPIVKWPREDGWNHYPFESTDWPLTTTKGCYQKATPVKDRIRKA